CRFFFFFSSRRRHTRFSRDWSSDVCSSDLDLAIGDAEVECPFWLDDLAEGRRRRLHVQRDGGQWRLTLDDGDSFAFDPAAPAEEIGRASCRERVERWGGAE